jgi:dTDP-4-amino-4,6-dideoxygalactose transaminase
MIPFNRPYFPQKSLEYLKLSIDTGESKGDGSHTAIAQNLISDISGGGEVLLTPSCTDALEMATLLLNLSPGDEVILPSYTFTSAATALVQFGIVPVFVDIHKDTKNIDVDLAERGITSRTRAISFVNYAGIGADFLKLRSLAARYGLALIEDNAHGLGGSQGDCQLGSVGDMSTLSFHESKNIQCGEGGALLINNPIYIERARILREKGTNRDKFMRGEIQKYSWVDMGSSYLLSDLLAGVLRSQLEEFTDIQSDRMETWNYYGLNLRDWSKQNEVRLHYVPENSKHTAHMYYIELEGEDRRSHLMDKLVARGIKSVFHYQALHSSPAGRKFGRALGDFNNTHDVESSILRIPIYFGMTLEEKEKVVSAITEVSL